MGTLAKITTKFILFNTKASFYRTPDPIATVPSQQNPCRSERLILYRSWIITPALTYGTLLYIAYTTREKGLNKFGKVVKVKGTRPTRCEILMLNSCQLAKYKNPFNSFH